MKAVHAGRLLLLVLLGVAAPLPGIDRRRSQAAASAGSMPSPSAPIT